MLTKWENDILFPVLNRTINALEKDLQCHIEQMIEKVCVDIKQLFIKIVKKQQKVAYITFHIMRKDILDGVYQYRVFLYDKNWYLTKGEQIGVLDSYFVYQYYDAFLKEILLQSNCYRSVFSVPELEMFAMRQLKLFHYHFVEVLRYAMNDITESEIYYKLKKEQHFEIQSGAYYESCDKLYQEDIEKDYGKWRRQFLEQEKKSFCFADLKGIDLKGFSAIDVDLRYADCRRSELQSVNFSNSNLQGARFQKSNLKQSNFTQTVINSVCFDCADLQQSCFEQAISAIDTVLLFKVHFAYYYTSFRGSCLREASFKKANLKWVDFREADIAGIDFTDAVLEQCIFSREQLKQIYLTEQQKQQIKIE